MDIKPKRPRIKKAIRYKSIYPEYFGFDPGFTLVFEKTEKGYVARIGGAHYIGFPSHLIEKNKHLFKLL